MFGPDAPSMAPSKALFQFSLAALAFGGIMFAANALTPESPVIPREYPYSGLVAELGGLEENKVRAAATMSCPCEVLILRSFQAREESIAGEEE